ncbi:uncharacterized protein [Ranitomeya imitator]|uniref:uncharacterized protein n=1 Tax=Ranitomeya imitator TaxID=111125 RepID=UPI0037E98C4A
MSSSEDLNVSKSKHDTDEDTSSAEEQERSSANESSQGQVPEAERQGVPQHEEGIDNDQLIPLVQELVALWDTRDRQHSTGFVGSSHQRQRAREISVMPEFIHLNSVFQEGIRVLGERLNTRFQEVNRRLDRLVVEVQRPRQHCFSAIEQGVSDLPPELQLNVMEACQLNVMEACQAAYSEAMQQSQTYRLQSEYYPSPVTPSSPTHTQSSQLDTPKVHNITPSDRPRT